MNHKNPCADRYKGLTGSRPNRRAQKRHNSALAGYAPNSSDKAFTKPGAQKHW